ncbi:GTP 3',8-cyclase MoaA [Ascidiimonas aurantiaca]|uniref:GTP 3',8-cyclase MoaA n=1 Tax=Ascidiimonas aurantiaca TaxID=1685432 RepID=UPI0030EB95BF
MLIDNHHRVINYLRLAVTDRCNLRCNYCMPEEGINFAKRDKLFTINELSRVGSLMAGMGIDKIRITGGEPFVRKDLMVLLRHLSGIPSLKEISVTTNATLIGKYIKELKQLGIIHVNVSMDAIERHTFEKITRRDHFDTVYGNLVQLINEGFHVKINFIVLDGQNTNDIIPMLELTRRFPVCVRFLEEMPFNGGSRVFNQIQWNYKRILEFIRVAYPDMEEIPSEKTSTSINYQIKGFKGSFGIIPSFSRTFCGTCNRLRISATGDVITCLYGKPIVNIRELLRSTNPDVKIKEAVLQAIGSRAKTGFEAQEKYASVFDNSMTSIGG